MDEELINLNLYFIHPRGGNLSGLNFISFVIVSPMVKVHYILKFSATDFLNLNLCLVQTFKMLNLLIQIMQVAFRYFHVSKYLTQVSVIRREIKGKTVLSNQTGTPFTLDECYCFLMNLICYSPQKPLSHLESSSCT